MKSVLLLFKEHVRGVEGGEGMGGGDKEDLKNKYSNVVVQIDF